MPSGSFPATRFGDGAPHARSARHTRAVPRSEAGDRQGDCEKNKVRKGRRRRRAVKPLHRTFLNAKAFRLRLKSGRVLALENEVRSLGLAAEAPAVRGVCRLRDARLRGGRRRLSLSRRVARSRLESRRGRSLSEETLSLVERERRIRRRIRPGGSPCVFGRSTQRRSSEGDDEEVRDTELQRSKQKLFLSGLEKFPKLSL